MTNNLKNVMDAMQEKWGDVGIVIYYDLSGHAFDESESFESIESDNCLFMFDNITKVTVEDIKNAPMVFEYIDYTDQ